MDGGRLRVRRGSTLESDEADAVSDVAEQLAHDASAVLFFCSPMYDLPRLGSLLRAAFPGVLVGRTTAGGLDRTGEGCGGITAISLAGPDLAVTPHLIRPLLDLAAQARRVGDALLASPSAPAFGLLLVDGRARAEERVASYLTRVLGPVPLVGPADDILVDGASVFFDGEFHSDAAVLACFETPLPFQSFGYRPIHVGPRFADVAQGG